MCLNTRRIDKTGAKQLDLSFEVNDFKGILYGWDKWESELQHCCGISVQHVRKYVQPTQDKVSTCFSCELTDENFVAATSPTTFSSLARSGPRNPTRRNRRKPQTESNGRRPLKYVVTPGWSIPAKGWVDGPGRLVSCILVFLSLTVPPGSHRFSQATTDFDGQRWLSFDSLIFPTPIVALIFLMQGKLPSKKKKKQLTDSWWPAGPCRPVLAAIRRHAVTATQDHIQLKYPGRSRRLERNMTRSRDSGLGTCPATLSHLVGLFGIDVEDISRAAKRGQDCEGHARKERCSSGAPSALLAIV